MTRPKPFLTYFILCAIPLLLLAGINYWRSVKAIESNISSIVQGDLNSINVTVDEILRDKERSVLRLALSPNVHRILVRIDPFLSPLAGDLDPHFHSLSLFNADRQPLWFRTKENNIEWKAWTGPANQPADIPQPDPRVWVEQGNVSLERPGSTPATF